MKVSLDYDVYKYLANAHLLPSFQAKPPGKVDLDEENSRKLMNGVKMGELLSYLDNTLALEMKDQNSLGIKLYNWNILSEAFQKLAIPFDNDIKTLIVQGDTEMINEVLKDVIASNLKRSSASYRQEHDLASQSLMDYLEMTIAKHFQIKQPQA